MDDFDNNFLKQLSRKSKSLLVGIDGCGGAGKSTLARKLKSSLEDVTIVQMDDFYFNDHFDWRRLKRQVLEPLSENLVSNYQRYDWQTKKLTEWYKIEVGGIVIVEGVYSTKRELANFYDYKIWVETPREIRLQRGIERDGEAMRDKWENKWMLAEDLYVQNDLPKRKANLIVNGYE